MHRRPAEPSISRSRRSASLRGSGRSRLHDAFDNNKRKFLDASVSSTRLLQQQEAAAWAAQQVGRVLETTLGMKVLLYGLAHPAQTPLAVVRREQTAFFQSGSLRSSDNAAATAVETATVGATEEFVENFNIRLHGTASRAIGAVSDAPHPGTRRRIARRRGPDLALFGGALGGGVQPPASEQQQQQWRSHGERYTSRRAPMGEGTAAAVAGGNGVSRRHHRGAVRRGVGTRHVS